MFRGDGLLCLFNLSPAPVTLQLTGLGDLIGPCQAAEMAGTTLSLGPNGVAFVTVTGPVGLA